MIAEYDGANAVQRWFVHGPGTDEPLVQYEGGSLADRRWLHADERGSIIAMTDSAGTAIAKNSYDEYGIPGSANGGRFQYTGQTWLPEIGMYYYKNRIYSPTLGRFLQTDPIGIEGGINLYAYVGNDPINFTDPLGLCGPGEARRYVGTTSSGSWESGFSVQAVYQCVTIPIDDNGGGRGEAGGGGGRATPQKTKPICRLTNNILNNSGKVTFSVSSFSATLLGTSGDAFGTFKTAGGYSGTFHTTFDGVFVGSRGLGASQGVGSSQSLATFRGVNYNLVATLGAYSISDNFDPNSGQHVGQTDEGSTLGLGIGGTRSDTTLIPSPLGSDSTRGIPKAAMI